jgi:hypothetical protein
VSNPYIYPQTAKKNLDAHPKLKSVKSIHIPTNCKFLVAYSPKTIQATGCCPRDDVKKVHLQPSEHPVFPKGNRLSLPNVQKK